MRFILIIILVILCMASTIRIDGVWPPAPINQHVEQTVRQVVEPGKVLRTLLGQRLPSWTDARAPSDIAAPATMIRAVAEGHRLGDQSGRECG